MKYNLPVSRCGSVGAQVVIEIQVFQESSALSIALLGRWSLMEVDVALRQLVRAFSREYDDIVCLLADVLCE